MAVCAGGHVESRHLVLAVDGQARAGGGGGAHRQRDARPERLVISEASRLPPEEFFRGAERDRLWQPLARHHSVPSPPVPPKQSKNAT